MRSIHILKDTPTTGRTNPDRLFLILKNQESGKPFPEIDLVHAMGFKSPAPLNCCMKALEQQGHIRIS